MLLLRSQGGPSALGDCKAAKVILSVVPLPPFPPMLLARKAEPFNHPEFIFEPKYDGFRALAIIRDGDCTLMSRNGNAFKSFDGLLRLFTARPLRVRENWTTELFGDYDPGTMNIRLRMRTAVCKEVTSCRTFLSTLFMSSVIISASTFSNFRTHGIREVSTSVPSCCITTRRERR